MIVDFVRVYTYGINDADYIQPLFAVLITIANAGHCLRLPYNILILAAGHYKQTQSNYIIAMILNIVVSIATVKMWGACRSSYRNINSYGVSDSMDGKI